MDSVGIHSHNGLSAETAMDTIRTFSEGVGQLGP